MKIFIESQKKNSGPEELSVLSHILQIHYSQCDGLITSSRCLPRSLLFSCYFRSKRETEHLSTLHIPKQPLSISQILKEVLHIWRLVSIRLHFVKVLEYMPGYSLNVHFLWDKNLSSLGHWHPLKFLLMYHYQFSNMKYSQFFLALLVYWSICRLETETALYSSHEHYSHH